MEVGGPCKEFRPVILPGFHISLASPQGINGSPAYLLVL